MITLDRMLQKTWSKHFYSLNGKSSRIQRTLQTWHHRITIFSSWCNTHLRTHTLLQLRRIPKMDEWIDCLEKPHSTVVELLCCRKDGKSSRKWRKITLIKVWFTFPFYIFFISFIILCLLLFYFSIYYFIYSFCVHFYFIFLFIFLFIHFYFYLFIF